jgi:hypothetical protein
LQGFDYGRQRRGYSECADSVDGKAPMPWTDAQGIDLAGNAFNGFAVMPVLSSLLGSVNFDFVFDVFRKATLTSDNRECAEEGEEEEEKENDSLWGSSDSE